MFEGRSDAREPKVLLPSVIFDADQFELRDRADAIHDFFSPAIDVTIHDTVTAPVSAKVEMWQLGNILVVAGESPELALRRTPRQVSQDGLDHWMLRVALSGEIRSRTGDRVYRQRRGDVVLDTMTEDFVDHWTRSDWISFVIPREGSESLEFVHRDSGPLQGPAIPLFADFAVSLARRLKEAGPEDAVPLSEVTGAMIRSCLLRTASRDEVARTDLAHRQRESVRAFIRQNLSSARLTSERICEMSGLSRSALYRLFETHGGVGRFIREMRLKLVMEDLRDPVTARGSISTIAESRGFHNASAFSRLFRQRFGCTPRDVRQAALLGAHLVAGRSRKTGRFMQLLG